AAAGPPDAEASAGSERAGAQLETTRAPAGPPPLPNARPPDTANDGVRLNTLPPTPLRPGSPEPAPDAPERDVAPPARTGPPPLPSAPTQHPGSPPLADIQEAGARPPPLPAPSN